MANLSTADTAFLNGGPGQHGNPLATKATDILLGDRLNAADDAATHSDGDGSDHADVATNTVHSLGTGSDHSDVATNTSAIPYALADPGDAAAIPVTDSATVAITTGVGAETNTLAIPTFLGQRMVLCMDVDGGGNRAITAASAINIAGNTVMTFDAARDCIELVAIQLAGVLAWEVVWNNNVALS